MMKAIMAYVSKLLVLVVASGETENIVYCCSEVKRENYDIAALLIMKAKR